VTLVAIRVVVVVCGDEKRLLPLVFTRAPPIYNLCTSIICVGLFVYFSTPNICLPRTLYLFWTCLPLLFKAHVSLRTPPMTTSCTTKFTNSTAHLCITHILGLFYILLFTLLHVIIPHPYVFVYCFWVCFVFTSCTSHIIQAPSHFCFSTFILFIMPHVPAEDK